MDERRESAGTGCAGGAGMLVEIRGAGADVLHEVVREGFAGLLAGLGDRRLPRFVESEFAAYLGCGDVLRGFAWLTCDGRDAHRIVPFSCKAIDRWYARKVGGRTAREGRSPRSSGGGPR